ncbi:MAG: hypothetical protein FJ404_09310 [Verrucomicrobia bacterium]|nr:hypothetical protein [Verrucomicrobiota bacterium]
MIAHLAQAAAPTLDYWPFIVLLISVGVIITLITVLKVHAFMALILAAITAGMLSTKLPGEPDRSHIVQAVELTATEFGVTAGKIGVVIALAAIIGMCLMESGAADKVVRRFIGVFGEKRAGAAIFISGYILSIPIFFDTFFMLLLPLAVAMRMRTGKDYLLYIMAICCGGTVTHSLVAPHPGPLAMAESLKLDLGLTIMVGTVVGFIPATCSWLVANWINARMDIPLRENSGVNFAQLKATADRPESELPPFFWSILPVLLPIFLISLASTLTAIQGKSFDAPDLKDPQALSRKLRTGEGPISKHVYQQFSSKARRQLEEHGDKGPLSRVLVESMVGELNRVMDTDRVLLTNTFAGLQLRAETTAMKTYRLEGENLARFNRMTIEDGFPSELRPTHGMNPALYRWGEFAGNRNIALFIGALLAVGVLMKQRGFTLAKIGELSEGPFATGGVIILITSAGGAFGLMLKNAGVGEAVQAFVAGKNVNLILLSWAIAAVIRVAQGSATVAMLTTAAMVYPIMSSGDGLPFHPIYIFMSIGFGAMFLSWMNDSGFWVVGKLSGFTEKETLRSWTVVVTVNSVSGLLVCWLASTILPFK